MLAYFVVAGLVLIGDVAPTWSFSAFTVLVYYALTNLAVLRLEPEVRRYPRAIAVAGLVGCLGLAFWIEPRTWLAGLCVIAPGQIRHAIGHKRGSATSEA